MNNEYERIVKLLEAYDVNNHSLMDAIAFELNKLTNGVEWSWERKKMSPTDNSQLVAYIKKAYEMNAFSINTLQNTMGIGFNRAGRMIASMEKFGICSKKEGTNPRVPLIPLEEALKLVDKIDAS